MNQTIERTARFRERKSTYHGEVSGWNTAQTAQTDFSQLGHLMASVNTTRHEEFCFFTPVCSTRYDSPVRSSHITQPLKSGPSLLSDEYFTIVSAAQFILQFTHCVADTEAVCVFLSLCVSARVYVCVCVSNGGEAPSSANNSLYSMMATERTSRERDCRAKLPK